MLTPCSPIRAAPIGSVSHSFCSFSLWKRLYTNRYYIILILATYTMISYVEFKKNATPPETLSFCCSHWGVECEKKMRIPGSLSLSLSLSLESEREERRKSESESWLAGSHPGLPYQPHAYQPPLAPHRPRPTLSARRVSTALAYPIGRMRANRPGLPYRAAACRPS